MESVADPHVINTKSKFQKWNWLYVTLAVILIIVFGTIACISLILKNNFRRAFHQAFDDTSVVQYNISPIPQGSLPEAVPSNFNLEVSTFLMDLQSRFYSYLDKIDQNGASDILRRREVSFVTFLKTKTSNLPAGLIFKHIASNSAIVLFRGTRGKHEGELDLMFNMTFPSFSSDTQKTWGNVRVHKGFLKYYDGFRELLRETLIHMKCANLYIFGHSLGGGVATLALYDVVVSLQLFQPQNVYVNTIGCPRVGNPDFCSAIQNFNLFRLQNSADMFVAVPLTTMPSFSHNKNCPPMSIYQHAGIGLMFHHRGKNLLESHTLPFYEDALQHNLVLFIEK